MKEFGAVRGRQIRNTGMTFETRPDYAKEEEIDRMLALGATKVELGVQHVNNEILRNISRGHLVEDSVEANRKARDSALKVGFHVMPGLPGSSIKEDKKMFERILYDSCFKPDYLKIYPTLVVKGTRLYDMWKKGEYKPICEEEAIEIIAYAKRIIPKWVRIQRIQRDIPSQYIEAGVKKSILRLRFPFAPHREELRNATLIRDLHVYGELVGLGERKAHSWQHRGYGARLLQKAEEITLDNEYSRIAVMSGIGVREYYERFGYKREGPFMVKNLSYSK